VFTVAPVKPSKQTSLLLDAMSRKSDEEQNFMERVMDQFDLLVT